MAATYRSATQGGARVAGTTGLTINKPASVANGDMLVAFIGAGDDIGTPYACTGWAVASGTGQGYDYSTTGNDIGSTVLYKKITNAAGEPSSYTFTCSDTAAQNRVGFIVCVALGDAIHEVTQNKGTNDFTPTHVNITTTLDGCCLLFFHVANTGTATKSSAGAPATPAGTTLIGSLQGSATSSNYAYGEAAYFHQTSAGTATVGAWTGSADDTSSEWHVYSVAISPVDLTGTHAPSALGAGSFSATLVASESHAASGSASFTTDATVPVTRANADVSGVGPMGLPMASGFDAGRSGAGYQTGTHDPSAVAGDTYAAVLIAAATYAESAVGSAAFSGTAILAETHAPVAVAGEAFAAQTLFSDTHSASAAATDEFLGDAGTSTSYSESAAATDGYSGTLIAAVSYTESAAAGYAQTPLEANQVGHAPSAVAGDALAVTLIQFEAHAPSVLGGFAPTSIAITQVSYAESAAGDFISQSDSANTGDHLPSAFAEATYTVNSISAVSYAESAVAGFAPAGVTAQAESTVSSTIAGATVSALQTNPESHSASALAGYTSGVSVVLPASCAESAGASVAYSAVLISAVSYAESAIGGTDFSVSGQAQTVDFSTSAAAGGPTFVLGSVMLETHAPTAAPSESFTPRLTAAVSYAESAAASGAFTPEGASDALLADSAAAGTTFAATLVCLDVHDASSAVADAYAPQKVLFENHVAGAGVTDTLGTTAIFNELLPALAAAGGIFYSETGTEGSHTANAALGSAFAATQTEGVDLAESFASAFTTESENLVWKAAPLGGGTRQRREESRRPVPVLLTTRPDTTPERNRWD